MGYFHSPARPLSQQQSSSYRGRSSPSLHVRQNNRQSVGVAHHYSSHFPTSSNDICAVVGGGGAFASPQPQQQYMSSSSPQQSSLQSAAAKGKARHATAHMKRAAPQDRNSFVPIAQGGRSPATSPTQRSSTPSSQAKKKASASPADNKKYKMELCNNFLKKGGCPFGSSCHFAHGFAELILPDPRDLVRDGKLLYICEIWASTGAW